MACINCKKMDKQIETQIKKMAPGFNRSQIAAMLGIHKQEVDKVLDAPVVEVKKSKTDDK